MAERNGSPRAVALILKHVKGNKPRKFNKYRNVGGPTRALVKIVVKFRRNLRCEERCDQDIGLATRIRNYVEFKVLIYP